MKKILVVDDDSSIRESISKLLEETGYEVKTANNGNDGVNVFEQFQPDLVITDISMPDMEGIELLKNLKKRKRDLPIIVMSGNVVGSKFFKSANLLGANSTLKKPFLNKDLISTIDTLLGS